MRAFRNLESRCFRPLSLLTVQYKIVPNVISHLEYFVGTYF